MRTGVCGDVSCQHRVPVPLITEAGVRGDPSRVRKRHERPQSPGSGSKEILFIAGGKMNIETDGQACFFTFQRLKLAPENHVADARGRVVVEKGRMCGVYEILVSIIVRRDKLVNATLWDVRGRLETVYRG